MCDYQCQLQLLSESFLYLSPHLFFPLPPSRPSPPRAAASFHLQLGSLCWSFHPDAFLARTALNYQSRRASHRRRRFAVAEDRTTHFIVDHFRAHETLWNSYSPFHTCMSNLNEHHLKPAIARKFEISDRFFKISNYSFEFM